LNTAEILKEKTEQTKTTERKGMNCPMPKCGPVEIQSDIRCSNAKTASIHTRVCKSKTYFIPAFLCLPKWKGRGLNFKFYRILKIHLVSFTTFGPMPFH
jgi:hypothetical protein